MNAELLVDSKCVLGEGPMWHNERKSLWWVDIEERKIFEYNIQTKEIQDWLLRQRVSLLLQIENEDDLLVALEDGIAKFNISSGKLTYIQHLEKGLINNRSNDGACDSVGRLWIGTMDMNCKPKSGALYCVNKNLTIRKKISRTNISNGIVWNMNFTKLYYIDSATYQITSYNYNLQTASIKSGKVIIDVPKELGMPDGMTIDSEGMLWIAHWGGHGVYRWDPDTGEIIDHIHVPAPNVTSCVFGGAKFEYLFITTASQSLEEQDLKKYPLSGSVFIAKPKISGFCANKFKLIDPFSKKVSVRMSK